MENSAESTAMIENKAYIGVDQSSDGTALFFRKPAVLLHNMLGHQKFAVRYKTFSHGHTEAVFDITGIDAAMAPLLTECKASFADPAIAQKAASRAAAAEQHYAVSHLPLNDPHNADFMNSSAAKHLR
jgi:hypothetical protein